MVRHRYAVLVLALILSQVAACGDDPTTDPGGDDARFLAGGGRNANDDPFAGGPDGSGPDSPEFDPPNPDYFPLFYAEQDCQENPSERIIMNEDEWQGWWTGAIACLEGRGESGDPPPPLLPPGDGAPGDSGVVYPDTLIFPYPPEAPSVDFGSNVVLTISLGADSTIGKGVWIQDVSQDPSGSVVHYLVSRLGDDCFRELMPPVLLGTTSPTIAVMVPRPVHEPITWQREEITYDCSWEPDPNEPLTLYYTDAECDLGPAETVITDSETFDAWTQAAFECDETRWYDLDGTPVPGDSLPGDPSGTPPTWIGLQVDFTTHAVIVLRAESQTRWGGGIWLSGIERTEGGTTIDYTVMTPGENCPPVEDGESVRPTVAIRLPLPLTSPVVWNRTSETISCDWGGGDPGDRDTTRTSPMQ